jgi:hypothetical protein
MLLSCASNAVALDSLARVTGVGADDVLAAVRSIEREDLNRDEHSGHALLRALERRLERPITGFSSVHYFHGTRIRDPGQIRKRGLLPLGEIVDELWRELNVLLADQADIDLDQLRAEIENGGGGDGGRLYRMKTLGLMHHGPFGEYVREHFLRPSELSNHDYLRTPELIEDISNAASELIGVGLLDAFTAVTRPCIVTFEVPLNDDSAAAQACCWYVWAAVRGVLTREACGGFDGQGVGVPPEAIRGVDFVC